MKSNGQIECKAEKKVFWDQSAFLLKDRRQGRIWDGWNWEGRKKSIGINFTNILRADFSCKRVLRSFYVLTVWVCNFCGVKEIGAKATFCTKVFCAICFCIQFLLLIFWQKEIGAKAACKMLLKFTSCNFAYNKKWPFFWNLPSISSTFYTRVFRTKFSPKPKRN